MNCKIERPTCETCGKDFSTNENLKHHIKRVHEGLKPNICCYCERPFASNSDLNKHIRRKHENDNSSEYLQGAKVISADQYRVFQHI